MGKDVGIALWQPALLPGRKLSLRRMKHARDGRGARRGASHVLDHRTDGLLADPPTNMSRMSVSTSAMRCW